jgi:hypothetical protein
MEYASIEPPPLYPVTLCIRNLVGFSCGLCRGTNTKDFALAGNRILVGQHVA